MNHGESLRRFRALTTPTDQVDPRKIRASAPEPVIAEGIATLRIYDPIDSWGEYWGISAKEFVETIDQLPADIEEIHLRINSPGGEVWEAIAILNALRAHDARVVATVEGIAASAASFVAVGADELIMARNSEMMIHDAWGICVGNAADMVAMAELLDHLSDNIASIYADKAGTEPAAWREIMTAETWYSAEEAVEAGLADRVDTSKTAGNAKNRFDLSVYNYAGRAAAPAPTAPITPATPAPESPAIPTASANRFRHLVASTRT